MNDTVTIDKQKMLVILIMATTNLRDGKALTEENLTWMEENIDQIEESMGDCVNMSTEELFIMLQDYFVKCIN